MLTHFCTVVVRWRCKSPGRVICGDGEGESWVGVTTGQDRVDRREVGQARQSVKRRKSLCVWLQRVSEWVEEEEAKRGIETDKRVRERSRMCLIIWRHLLLLYNCCWISFADSTPLWMSASSHIFPFCLFQHIKTPIWTFHTSPLFSQLLYIPIEFFSLLFTTNALRLTRI